MFIKFAASCCDVVEKCGTTPACLIRNVTFETLETALGFFDRDASQLHET